MLVWQFVNVWRKVVLFYCGKSQKEKATGKIIKYKTWKHTPFISVKYLNTRSKIFQKNVSSSAKTGWQGQVSGGGEVLLQQEEMKLRGELGWWWMPQKASRYPPIHDQIDTPIDFSVAVWQGWQRRDGSTSQREAESYASGSETMENPQHDNKVKHTTDCENVNVVTFSTQWQMRDKNACYDGRLTGCVSVIIQNSVRWRGMNDFTSRSTKVVGLNMHSLSFTILE